MPKILFFLFISLFGLVLLTDLLLIKSSYIKIEKALGQAIDASIIEGTYTGDHQRGLIKLNEDSAKIAARTILVQTLNLNATLQNELFSNSRFDLEVVYLNDVPRIEAEFITEVSFTTGRLVGLQTYQINVRKKTPYLTEFK